jgi:hypothetical protein
LLPESSTKSEFLTSVWLGACTECEYMISGKRKYLALCSLERLQDKTFFYSALCLGTLLLQLFPSISHLIRHSWSAVYLSLLTPSILRQGYFVKFLAKARKSLRGFRKLSRRSAMTSLDENADISVLS